ncbi:MAG: M23 family metallopeptidase, partial [Chitinivibrionales bacterium]|nr:M23 family metallopeptidase [Chitinivibrionales bacterium]
SGLYRELNTNRVLLKKIDFLTKLSDETEKKMHYMTMFEEKVKLKYGIDIAFSSSIADTDSVSRSVQSILIDAFEDPVVHTATMLEQSVEKQTRLISVHERTFTAIVQKLRIQQNQWSQRPSVWPMHGRITSSYGNRLHPIVGISLFHDGIDIANTIWTPISATANGVVTFAGFRGYYGTTVIITHKETGFQTVYAHMQQTAVVEGQRIRRGDLVGYMGGTGRSTGPHLHYEIRKNGRTTNPMGFMMPEDYIID